MGSNGRKTATLNSRTDRKVNTIDVARLAGLSRTTVSYVLNNREDVSIPQTTRDRVHRAASQLGYRRNVIARSLVSGKTRTIGVIVPALELSTTADIINGMEGICTSRQYRMLLAYSHNDPEIEVEQARFLLEYRVDGIVCVVGYKSLAGTPHWAAEVVKEKLPCVVVDSSVAGVRVDYVVGNDRNGAMFAVSHLIGLGHRRIAHLSAGTRSAPACERREGYRSALLAARLPIDERLIVGDSFEPDAAAQAMSELLQLSEPPTAVFAADDNMAAAAMEVLRRRGKRVPEDVAIVGFNDIALAPHLRLTTVRLSAQERGRIAIERLFARMNNPNLPIEGLVVPTELVVRESCGAKLIGQRAIASSA
jgi:LacI family transcriptional regulator